jgi:FkbM family methyltransferase
MKPLEPTIQNEHFRKSSLFRSFNENPLGFIDLGSAGDIHPVISPMVSLTHCTCFEPDRKAWLQLQEKYISHQFAELTIFNMAVGKKSGKGKLYLTQSPVNSSLLKPNSEMTLRYGMKGFLVDKVLKIPTVSLDDIVYNSEQKGKRLGEFIKTDCQGAEYDIFQGARKVLKEQCQALWCEVEFFQMYHGQRTFAEVDCYLREHGFQLYGLYPNYVSAKKINRREGDTEERLAWADALYFKDPLGNPKNRRCLSERDSRVLLLVAVLTGFYDYALELVETFFKSSRKDYTLLKRWIISLAEGGKKILEIDLRRLVRESRRSPEKAYVLTKKFIDRHGSNNNCDFIHI